MDMLESIFHISSDRVVDEIDRARAQEYALLAILLSRSPDSEMIERLALRRRAARPAVQSFRYRGCAKVGSPVAHTPAHGRDRSHRRRDRRKCEIWTPAYPFLSRQSAAVRTVSWKLIHRIFLGDTIVAGCRTLPAARRRTVKQLLRLVIGSDGLIAGFGR